jgi:cyclophilin family peptidyl-prolyl cis-trans isomerase
MRTSILLLLAVPLAAADLPAGLYAIFNTSLGNITAKLNEKDVPQTVQNFVGLAQGTKASRNPKTGAMVKRPLYDGITFHRVVHDEMIQAGDPTGTGSFNCGVTIPDEMLPGLRFDRAGKLAMANTGAPDSAGCQFFITVSPMQSWDGKYAVFGAVVEGQDVVDKINRAPLRGDRPIDPVKLISVTISRVGPEPPQKPPKKPKK